MFQFSPLSSVTYGFSHGSPGITPGGLPHSDISGSLLARSSPELFAACHVLLRLRTPKHPPCTLGSLTAPKDSHPKEKRTPDRRLHAGQDASHPFRTVKDPIPGPPRPRRGISSRLLGKPGTTPGLAGMNPVPPALAPLAETVPEIRALSASRRLRGGSRHPASPFRSASPRMEMTGFEPAPSCLQSRRSPG